MSDIFERLDTSPGQEKEIKGALREFFDVAVPTRRDLRGLANDAGSIFGPEGLDESALSERFAEGAYFAQSEHPSRRIVNAPIGIVNGGDAGGLG